MPIYMKIDGVEGESTAEGHRNEIDVLSFSWGLSNVGAASTSRGGSSSGKVSFSDISFTTRANKASPILFLSCASGKHIKKAVITVRKAGGEQQDYYKITLTDLLISNFSNTALDDEAGSGEVQTAAGDVPTEQLSINFSKIEFEFRPQAPDGSLGSPVKSGWDLRKNSKV